ncbi:unnamed protein product [Durusdinium trenchii]|uniref:AB hydrolase-1 domain-containing protein n=1 Tax=Durusdinium trenchii TaxID=1381693 RepID=A0ABP0JN62_9DINO
MSCENISWRSGQELLKQATLVEANMFARAWKCCIFDPILGPGGGFEVVGHSFGSHLVLRLGAMLADTMLAGDTIAGLILLGAAKQFPEGHPIFRLPVFVLQWLQPSLTKAFLQMALASNDPELIQQETDGCNANPMYMCKAYYRQVRNVSDDEIAKCRSLPSLLIRGGQDGIVSASDVEALAVAMPLAQMKTVANAGHVPMLEEPGKVAELIDEFIKSI